MRAQGPLKAPHGCPRSAGDEATRSAHTGPCSLIPASARPAERHPCRWAPLCTALQGDLAPQAPLDAVAHPGGSDIWAHPRCSGVRWARVRQPLPCGKTGHQLPRAAPGPSWLPWCRPGCPVRADSLAGAGVEPTAHRLPSAQARGRAGHSRLLEAAHAVEDVELLPPLGKVHLAVNVVGVPQVHEGEVL